MRIKEDEEKDGCLVNDVYLRINIRLASRLQENSFKNIDIC